MSHQEKKKKKKNGAQTLTHSVRNEGLEIKERIINDHDVNVGSGRSWWAKIKKKSKIITKQNMEADQYSVF